MGGIWRQENSTESTEEEFLSSLEDDSVVLILASGQSNFLGVGSIADPGYTLSSKIWFKEDIFSFSYDGAWQTMQFGTNINVPNVHSGHNVGNPSFYLANLLETEFPNLNFYFLQCGLGGRGFESGAGEFSAENEGVNSIRNVLFERFFNRGLPTLPEEVFNKKVYALFFFVHGEQDGTNSTWAADYKNYLEYFLAEVDGYIENIPKHVIQLNAAVNQTTIPELATIRTAQNQLALEDPNVSLVNIDDVSMDTDGVHYTSAGYEQISRNLLSSIKLAKLPRIL